MKNKCFNINAGLAGEVIRERKIEDFRHFLVVKALADGCGAHFQNTKQFREEAASRLGCSERTVRRRIQDLENCGWIGRKGSELFPRRFGQLIGRYGVETSSCHNANVFYVTETKERFRSFLFALFTGSLVGRRHHALVRNATHISRGGSKPSFNPGQGETFAPGSLSLSFLARRLGLSKTWVYRRKREAIEQGFLEREKYRFKFPGVRNLKAVRSAFPDEAYRTHLSFNEGCVVIQLTDRLASPLRYKSRRQN
jgi:DNA-binding Lrp family transcriptional regulator